MSSATSIQLIDTTYIVAVVLFILAIKWLSSPKTAKHGVLAGEIAAALALGATLFDPQVEQYKWILVALAVGAGIGIPLGMVKMTAVPQRTALSHAFGALSAAMIGIAEYYVGIPHVTRFGMAEIGLEVVIGSLTFTGSLIAAAKLQEVKFIPQRPVVYKGQNFVSLSVLAAAILLIIALVINPEHPYLFPIMVVVSLIFGVLLVTPIGGADMPTVISLLNSYAGFSAALLGFVLNSKVLVVAGALDGSSGFILSVIMCKAMNRSFTNVMFGAFGQVQTAAVEQQEARSVRSASPEEAAAILEAASKVVIVPGYGMAVAQAQHKVRELYDALTKRGIEVTFGIHPVAGRMPGHMNVLLAEANVPYDEVLELEEINRDFASTDVAYVIGANDVTNPAAKTDPASPIYGMPVLDVEKAKTVLFVKRSMASGYAGVENELFYRDNTMMLFGDAKKMTEEIVKSLE